MKKILYALVCITLVCFLVSCKKDTSKQNTNVDYNNAEMFEQSLNDGDDTIGKIVCFVVEKINPNSTFGYNLMTGEHLNFCSPSNPKVNVNDEVKVKIREVTYFIGSYIIYYELIK